MRQWRSAGSGQKNGWARGAEVPRSEGYCWVMSRLDPGLAGATRPLAVDLREPQYCPWNTER